MKLLSRNKIKALLLSTSLSLILLLSGCSADGNYNNGFNSSSTSQMQETESVDKFALVSEQVPKDCDEAIVERVVDGDTLKLRLKESNKVVRMRLLSVDTPESVKEGVEPQPYSKEASNFAKETLKENDTVYIEYDGDDKTDKYDRYLGYLWYFNNEDNNWQMFNKTIIEKGLARVGYVYSQKKHLDELYEAQDKAKKEKLNIWSVEGYVTNRGFDVDAYNRNSSSFKSNTSDNVVYANKNKSSQKYHLSQYAHNMKKSLEMKESEALSKGYDPCKICFK